MIEKSLPELADRYTILQLKIANRVPNWEEVSRELEEIRPFLKPLLGREGGTDPLLGELMEANAKVWRLEAQVGSLALEIRAANAKRTEIKNKMAEIYGGFKDEKIFYAKG